MLDAIVVYEYPRRAWCDGCRYVHRACCCPGWQTGCPRCSTPTLNGLVSIVRDLRDELAGAS